MRYKLLLLILLVATLPYTTHAADFVGLVGIPGLENPTAEGGLGSYINALYRLSISIAALLAVIKIVAAGAKYMLSDIVTHKEDAKKDIQGALIGLLIVIGAIIILNTVNSDLTNLDIGMATTTIEQGPTIEEYLEAANQRLEERAEELDSVVVVGECYTYLGDPNGYDVLPGESKEAACKRSCEGPTFKGEFINNWVWDQCKYVEGEAELCDPQLNRPCCESIKDGTWYAAHNMCSVGDNIFEEIVCGTNTADAVASCDEAKAECAAAGSQVLSEGIGYLPGSFGGSYAVNTILCSDEEQSAINEEIETRKQQCLAAGHTWIEALSTCQDPTEVIPPIM